MGLFHVRSEKLEEIQTHVWFPELRHKSEWTRVMSQPGFKQRYDTVLVNTNSIVDVFQVNKPVKGPHGIVPADQPGIAARLEDGVYAVEIPIRERAFQLGAYVTREVALPQAETDPYEHGPEAGRIAVAMAIQQYVNEPK